MEEMEKDDDGKERRGEEEGWRKWRRMIMARRRERGWRKR